MNVDNGSTFPTKQRTLHWSQVDVFAERALEGNMLAIFTDARGLTDAEMQALARETNLSETTFILPADEATERDFGVRVRIFTTEEEFPFAGHPTLGTASWIWANHPVFKGADEVRLSLNIGTIPVRFTQPKPGEHGVYGEMQQRDPIFGDSPSRVDIAEACGLHLNDLHPTLSPQVVSTGLPFCIVPVVSLDALQRFTPSASARTFLAQHGARSAYAIAPMSDGTWRTRLPFHGSDDPATGSAAGCAISYLVQHKAVRSDEPTVFLQGVEVRRPSRLDVRASISDATVTNVFVGGRTIPVASGVFMLP